MENRNNTFKLRNLPFSLSPKGDRHAQTPQNAATFLNIFSLKDKNRLVKKNTDVLKYAELTTQKIRESTVCTPKKEQRLEFSKRMVIKHISNHAKIQEKLIKRPENAKLTNIKSEKALEFIKSEKVLELKENELNSNVKTIKVEKEEKKEKYKNTPENELKLFFYFRFHLHSLLINSGKREKFEEVHNNVSMQPLFPNLKKNYISSEDSKEQASICHRLLKIISTKSKYKSRFKLVFSKSLGLKSINFELKKRNTLLPNKVSNKKSPVQEIKKEVVSTQNIVSFAMNDIDYWKKKNNLPSNAKIFLILGNYPALKKGFIKRGWYENPDPTSSVFHLKYCCKVRDIDYGGLKEEQIVNHFGNSGSFTTKIGLCRNIRNLIWFHNIDVDAFYPRCYDLNESADFDDFVEEYKFTMAESILKEFIENFEKIEHNWDKFTELKVKVAMFSIFKKNWDIYEKIFNIRSGMNPMISNKEWEILLANSFSELPKESNEVHNSIRANINTMLNLSEDSSKKELYMKINQILQELKTKNPQYNLNGSKNIWILKPTMLSRGRGIKCFNNLVEIINYIYGKKSLFVCQKYMENPLIINKKKFDIRQWVLVTNWDPLTVWFYKESYVRFGAELYDPHNLNNRFIHLTNNSIAKYSEKFEQSEIEGNMWSMQEFIDYIIQETGEDIFTTKIQPKFKQYVIDSLKSCLEMVQKRKNTFEIFGFDFMIDDNYNPWIIEINQSPAMDYSTPVTEKLVPMFLEDALKVVLDYGMAKKGQKKKIDTGLFMCICKGNRIKI